ncbi:MAG: hypothetical protein O6940_13245 [Ignavibacteria bacterium]|nr:hypothetical protein [Ignavibacteria bacterium]
MIKTRNYKHMNNTITCSSCSNENPSYVHICENCNSFIRERVYNIDLWDLIGLLIESPGKAFKHIVYSEHKNFIGFVLFLITVKFLVDARFVSLVSLGSFNPATALYLSYSIVLVSLTVFLILYSYCFTLVNEFLNIKTRFRDNFSVLVYSLIPNVFGIVFLFVIELVVFGEYLFSINPSPFVVKEFVAYLLAGAELSLIIWSVFLSYIAFRVQTNSMLLSIINTLVFNIFIAALLFFSSKYIFTL